jgi:hypothetical protein
MRGRWDTAGSRVGGLYRFAQKNYLYVSYEDDVYEQVGSQILGQIIVSGAKVDINDPHSGT